MRNALTIAAAFFVAMVAVTVVATDSLGPPGTSDSVVIAATLGGMDQGKALTASTVQPAAQMVAAETEMIAALAGKGQVGRMTPARIGRTEGTQTFAATRRLRGAANNPETPTVRVLPQAARVFRDATAIPLRC